MDCASSRFQLHESGMLWRIPERHSRMMRHSAIESQRSVCREGVQFDLQIEPSKISFMLVAGVLAWPLCSGSLGWLFDSTMWDVCKLFWCWWYSTPDGEAYYIIVNPGQLGLVAIFHPGLYYSGGDVRGEVGGGGMIPTLFSPYVPKQAKIINARCMHHWTLWYSISLTSKVNNNIGTSVATDRHKNKTSLYGAVLIDFAQEIWQVCWTQRLNTHTSSLLPCAHAQGVSNQLCHCHLSSPSVISTWAVCSVFT